MTHASKAPLILTVRHSAARRWLLLALAFSLGIGLAAPAWAATQTASGTVTDALGRPLAQVEIELRDEQGRLIAHTTTDEKGRFGIAPPKPGAYSLLAVSHGFKTAGTTVVFPHKTTTTIAMTLDSETALTVPIEAHMIRAQNTVSSTGANKYTV